MNIQEEIKQMSLEQLLQTALQMSTELDTKGIICRKWSESNLERLKIEESTCKKLSSNFESIMKRFKELKVEFKPEAMKEVVQKLVSEFEFVVSKKLPNTQVDLPTAEEVSNEFDKAIGNSRKQVQLKGLRRRQQAEKRVKETEKDCEIRCIKGKQYDVALLKQSLWNKWIELNEMMLEGMELLKSLKTWKIKVSSSIGLLSSLLCQALQQSEFAADARNQCSLLDSVHNALKKINFDWSLFSREQHVQIANQVQSTQKSNPHRFSISSMFPVPQPSTTQTQDSSPTPLPISIPDSPQTEASAYSTQNHYEQFCGMMSPTFLHVSPTNHYAMFPEDSSCFGSRHTPYQVPFFNHQIYPDINIQAISLNSPTFSNSPMVFPPMNDFRQLPVLRPSQYTNVHDAPKLDVGNHTITAADNQLESENKENDLDETFINVVD